MGEWEDGRMGEWENGRMREWESGGVRRTGEWERTPNGEALCPTLRGVSLRLCCDHYAMGVTRPLHR